MAKILVTTIQVNLCCLIPASLEIGTNSPELSLLKFLSSTITTADSWLPAWISQLFYPVYFTWGRTIFSQLGFFE